MYPLKLEDLNGAYDLSYLSLAGEKGPVADGVKAELVVKDGSLKGQDILGGIWNGTLWISAMSSVGFQVDVSVNETQGVYLLDRQGKQTQESQRYTGELSVRRFENSINLGGIIEHGVVKYRILLVKKVEDGQDIVAA